MKNKKKNLFKNIANKIKNLPKKPDKGGIPAKEKNKIAKIKPKSKFEFANKEKSHNKSNFSFFILRNIIIIKNIPNKINI